MKTEHVGQCLMTARSIFLRYGLMICCLIGFIFPLDGFSTSPIRSDRAAVVTNVDTVAYSAVAFSNETNKISIVAAGKVLELFERLAEAESLKLSYEYTIVKDNVTIQKFLEQYTDPYWFEYEANKIKFVLGNSKYEMLSVVDLWMRDKMREARVFPRFYYDTEYENIRSKMTADELCAFFVIFAHMKTKVNEIFVKTIIEYGLVEKGRNPDHGSRRMDEAMRDIIKRVESRGAANTNVVARPSISKGKDD